MADDGFIVPPPWLVPPAAPVTPRIEQADDTPDPITVPPGVADSATFRMPQERQRTPPPPPAPDVVFFPSTPGLPPAPPVQADPPAPPTTPTPMAPPPPPPGAAPLLPPPPPVQLAPPAPPVQSAPPAPPVQLAPPAPPVVEVDDSTVHVSRQARAWRLELGESPPVIVRGALFLGRNPSANSEHPDASVLAVNDPSKSVSKTHAMLELREGGLWLTDLHSTNGCRVLAPDGSEVALKPGEAFAVAAGSTIELGEYAIRVSHG